jgi:hypothetical protein
MKIDMNEINIDSQKKINVVNFGVKFLSRGKLRNLKKMKKSFFFCYAIFPIIFLGC